MREPTKSVILTVGNDVDVRGLELVQLCARIEAAMQAARPEIDWTVGADLQFATTTIKVEPDWPENYAEVNTLVGPFFRTH